MKAKFIFKVSVLLVVSFLVVSSSFAGSNELKLMKKKTPDYKIKYRTGLFFGYDSNAKLSGYRNSDSFERSVFSMDFIKPLEDSKFFTFDYDLNYIHYNEFESNTSMLNHLKFALHKKISPFTLGSGYDVSYIYYPHNNDGNSFFHRVFIYGQQDLSKNLYHKIQFEPGWKFYLSKDALADSLNTFRDSKRHDQRWAVFYNVGAKLNPRLSLNFKSKFSLNDSNSKYIDFYDYKAYKQVLDANYKLLEDLYLFSGISYTKKKYKSRTVTLADYEQIDDLYSGLFGVKYNLDKQSSLFLYYVYRQNNSNDTIAEYSESVITAGWQHDF